MAQRRPGSENWVQKEVEYTVGNAGLKAVRNVVKPSITVYLPRLLGFHLSSIVNLAVAARDFASSAVIVQPGGLLWPVGGLPMRI